MGTVFTSTLKTLKTTSSCAFKKFVHARGRSCRRHGKERGRGRGRRRRRWNRDVVVAVRSGYGRHGDYLGVADAIAGDDRRLVQQTLTSRLGVGVALV